MQTNDLPIILTVTEDLKARLKTEIHNLKMSFWVIFELDARENRNDPYRENDTQEEEEIWDLISAFSDECRDNYLMINNEGMAKRYSHLLTSYFHFLSDAKKEIQTCIKKFYTQFVQPNEFEWHEENENTYHGGLLSRSGFMLDEAISHVEQIVNQYELYLSESTPTTTVNHEPKQTNSDQLITNRPRKKERLTHKQQMVLVQWLGLDKHPLLIDLKPAQRGNIIGELLNRSVDDTKNMLNLETSKGDDKLNWDTDYERGQVQQFLQRNGIDLTR